MTIRSLLACLAAALLTAGSATAQPALGTPADAELAAVRLVEAARARDWPTLATFVDLETAAELTLHLPATRDEAEAQLRDWVVGKGGNADSLFVVAEDPAAEDIDGDGPAADLRQYRRFLDSIYDSGPMDPTAIVARALSALERCEADGRLMMSLFDSGRYDPVRAVVRADGTVEAVGHISVVVEGERVEGLAVTPLRWTEGRWTIHRSQIETPDAELNPVAEIVSVGADVLQAVLYAAESDAEGPGGCTGDGE